jgi:RNA exonuclease 1
MGTAFDGDSELIRVTVIDYFTCETLIDSLVYPDIPMQHFNTRWSGIRRADMERALQQGQCIMGRDAARQALFEYVGASTIVVGHSAQNDLSALRWIHHRVVDSHMVESAVRKETKLREEQEKKEKGEEVDNNPKEGEPKDGQKKREKRGKGHPDGMSLKALAMKRLGRAIQVGKKGHDSLEDALAARDLIHSHLVGLGGSEV